MGIGSHEEPILLCASHVEVDQGLWEKLEEMELREDPAELGGMVQQVRQELLGMKEMPPAFSSFRQAMDRKLQPKLLPPPVQSKSAGSSVAQVPNCSAAACGAARYGGRGDSDEDLREDMSMKFVYDKLMARLGRIERRLDRWNVEQQHRLEQAINGHTSLKARRQSIAPDRMKGRTSLTALPDGGYLELGRGKGRHSHKVSVGFFESTPKEDDDQPEREESPLQEEDNTTNGRAEIKDWVSESSCAANGRRSGRDEAPGNGHGKRETVQEEPAPSKARRSSNFALLTKKSSTNSANRLEDMQGKPKSILAPIVYHPVFDYFFAAVIMLNSVYIGFQTHYRMVNVETPEDPPWFEFVERVFAGLFFIELAMRMFVLKCEFFALKGLVWNLFDTTLVMMSVVELILPLLIQNTEPGGGGGNVGKVIRMFRMVRIIRIMRVLRFLAELRVLVTLIIHSVRSLFWLLVLLGIILYVFSIFFTQGVFDYLLENSPEEPVKAELKRFYGGLNCSCETLFLSITGGISWVEVVQPLKDTGPFFVALFFVYVFFCVFSVLNIVTGVFVDGAIQRSAQERDLRLEKEKEQKKAYVSMLMDLLEEIDAAGTGVITRLELEEAFKSDLVRYSFSVLDIDISDSNYLFDMLDLDGSGEVDMEEFVSGCLRLKGHAKSIDIHTLMFEVKHLMRKVDNAMMLSAPPPDELEELQDSD